MGALLWPSDDILHNGDILLVTNNKKLNLKVVRTEFIDLVSRKDLINIRFYA
jgi:hypothetical protein